MLPADGGACANCGVFMIINGVIRKKLEIIQDTLTELERLEPEKIKTDFFLKRGVERSIQICIEAMIDIAHRIVSLKDHPPVSSAGNALSVLEQLGIIQDAGTYKKMVQFRNLIVHRYEIIDDDIIITVLRNHLDDFSLFIKEITASEGNGTTDTA